MYRKLNINPVHKRADDCTVRAIATILDKSWEEIYSDLCIEGLRFYDMPSANHVWGSYLKKKGFNRHIIPDTCPQCYTVENFARDNPKGKFILALNGHVVPVIDGCIYDSFDSSEMMPMRYSGRRGSYGMESNSGRRYSGDDESEYMANRMRREMYN